MYSVLVLLIIITDNHAATYIDVVNVELTIKHLSGCDLNQIPLPPSLHRCYFIYSIALWLEKIDAINLTLLEETELPFLVLSALLLSISLL